MVRVFLRIWHHICVLCPCSPSSSVTLIRLPSVGDWWAHLNLQQQLPISLLLHPRRGFPPVPDHSACRGLCRLQTHTSCSFPVVPLFLVLREPFSCSCGGFCVFFLTPAVFIALCSSFCVFPEDILSPALAAVLHAGFSSPFSLPYCSFVKPVFTDL